MFDVWLIFSKKTGGNNHVFSVTWYTCSLYFSIHADLQSTAKIIGLFFSILTPLPCALKSGIGLMLTFGGKWEKQLLLDKRKLTRGWEKFSQMFQEFLLAVFWLCLNYQNFEGKMQNDLAKLVPNLKMATNSKWNFE